MADFPLDTAGRSAERAKIRARLLADVERLIVATARSLKCSGDAGRFHPHHAGTEGGCRNDGTGCICECHDGGSRG